MKNKIFALAVAISFLMANPFAASASKLTALPKTYTMAVLGVSPTSPKPIRETRTEQVRREGDTIIIITTIEIVYDNGDTFTKTVTTYHSA